MKVVWGYFLCVRMGMNTQAW